MELRAYQHEAVESVYDHLRRRDDNPCVVLPTGCHAAGHPILMYDGRVERVEDIQVGDVVMGPDSQPRRVLALCRGEDEMYRVTPLKGEPFVVNGDHILSLVCTNEGKPQFACYRKGGEIDNVSVRDCLQRSKSWRHLRKLYRVPIEFRGFPALPIPPYILGLLLGDGGLTEDSINLTTLDDEIEHAWEDYAHAIGCGLSVRDHGGRCPTYRLRRQRGKYNILSEALDAIGLAGCGSATKFIPEIYLRASRHDRLQLLAGLIDSDGHASKSGVDYTTASHELADDILFLTRSLGFWSKTIQKYSACQTGAGGWYYRISIWGDFSQVPIRLARRVPAPRRQKKSVLRTGFRIERIGRGPYFGFVLDGDHLYVDGHFVVHHNSGKTPVIATMCRDAVNLWNGRVVILAHVKELLEQAADKLRAIAPDVPVGIYSAGLKRKDLGYAVTIAGIQSIYQRACDLGAVDLVIVDESHLIPPDGEGMYRQFLADAKVVNPSVRVIGLTATPFRMKTGTICAPDHILNEVCYEIGVRELIVQGFLSPLRTKAGSARVDTSELHVRAGEFIAGEVEDLMDTDALVDEACAEIVELTPDRCSVLIFTSGVRHGEHVARILSEKHGVECGFIEGNTPTAQRDELIDRFKRSDLKYLANVNVLTTGFDAPNVDCVALLRPTLSPGLYCQMVGRGFRLCEGKTDCLVLDFGGNVLRHGPVDQIRLREQSSGNGEAPAKECPECNALIAAGYATCPECGYEFPPPEREKHDASATSEGILSDQTSQWDESVSDVSYNIHHKRDDPTGEAPPTMRVEYRCGFNSWHREWVCFEHTGYARAKAEQWWRARSREPVPDTVEEAIELAEAGALAPTLRITIEKKAGEKYDRIVAHELGEIPPRLEDPDDLPNEWVGAAAGISEEDVPF